MQLYPPVGVQTLLLLSWMDVALDLLHCCLTAASQEA